VRLDVVQLLVGLVLVSVLYHALVFYLSLFRMLMGRWLRRGEPNQRSRSSHPSGPVSLLLVSLTLAILMASGFMQSLRVKEIRQERQTARGTYQP
jgi:hypothetical protein